MRTEMKGKWHEHERTCFCMCVYLIFPIFTHINCDHHGGQGHAFRKFLSVRFWTWHGGTMKGYDQTMEGHGR